MHVVVKYSDLGLRLIFCNRIFSEIRRCVKATTAGFCFRLRILRVLTKVIGDRARPTRLSLSNGSLARAS